MNDPIGTEAEQPGWGSLLWRGITKRCPHCGSGHVFEGWFHMKERCPRCALRFEREPGFFVGAYLINFAVAIILLFVVCMVIVAMKALDNSADLTVPFVVGAIIAVGVPPFFYPFSKTVWSAIDIGMTPLEVHELEDAAAHRPVTA
jgi:uncharacterized protein (DUF983 family)